MGSGRSEPYAHTASRPQRTRPESVDRLHHQALPAGRRARGPDQAGGRRGDVQPDDLPEGDRRRRPLRRAAARSSRRRVATPTTRSSRSPSRTSRAPATCSPTTFATPGENGIRDGWVSLEVDPRLAHDAERTLAEARRLHELVDRPNLMVKIPGTEEGLEAIESAIAMGIPVNVTLLFSLERHREAADAYVRGLRRLHEAGGDLRALASVASFFVSRVDTEADRRLEEIGRPRRPQGQARDRERQARLPDLPARSSQGASGRSLPPPGQRRSVACGRRPQPRTRSTGT